MTYEEKNIRDYLETLYRLCGTSPKPIYRFLRIQYLTECCNYPYKNAKMIAEKEWNKLMEKIGERKKYG